MNPLPIIACATCRPTPGSLIAQAQDQAVIVMLVALFSVMAVVIYTIVSFAKGQARVVAENPELFQN